MAEFRLDENGYWIVNGLEQNQQEQSSCFISNPTPFDVDIDVDCCTTTTADIADPLGDSLGLLGNKEQEANQQDDTSFTQISFPSPPSSEPPTPRSPLPPSGYADTSTSAFLLDDTSSPSCIHYVEHPFPKTFQKVKPDDYVFKFEDFQYQAKMNKSRATHHSFNGWKYYEIPSEHEDEVARKVIMGFLKKEPLFICEHPHASCTRFYIDLDGEYDNENSTKILGCIHRAVVDKFSQNDIAYFKNMLNVEHLMDWGVNTANIDCLLMIILGSRKSSGLLSLHLIWPYVILDEYSSKSLFESVKERVIHELPDFDKRLLEHPQSLRAPFCDKMENNHPCERPYLLMDVYSSKKCTRFFPPDRTQWPQYPFLLDHEYTEPEMKFRAIWALTSLRWVTAHKRNIPMATTFLSPAPSPSPSPQLPLPIPMPMSLSSQTSAIATSRRRLVRSARRFSPLPASSPYTSSSSDFSSDDFIDNIFKKSAETDTEWLKSKITFSPSVLGDMLKNSKCVDSSFTRKLVIAYLNCCVAVCHFPTVTVAYKANEHDGNVLSFMNVQQAKLMLGAPLCKVTGQKHNTKGEMVEYEKNATPFTIWSESKKQRIIKKAILETSPDVEIPSDILNLWQGFKWTDEECYACKDFTYKGYGLLDFLAFIYSTDFAKNETNWMYGVKWMAIQRQKPGTVCATSLVFGGPEGCGKSTVLEAFGKGFGKAFMRTSSVDDVIGKFNGRILGKIFILLEELDCLTSSQNALLKAIITDDTKRMENKFHMAHFPKQPINIAITTNRPMKQIMKVSASARRFALMKAETIKECDAAYFFKLHKWLDGGDLTDPNYVIDAGRKSFWNFLKYIDIENFNPRNPPPTFMLLQQKLGNMERVHSFIWDCLTRKKVSYFVNNQRSEIVWPDNMKLEIVENIFYDAYKTFCKESLYRSKQIHMFITQVQGVLPCECVVKPVIEFSGMGVAKYVPKRHIILPSLEDAMKSFVEEYKYMDKFEELALKQQQTDYRTVQDKDSLPMPDFRREEEEDVNIFSLSQ